MYDDIRNAIATLLNVCDGAASRDEQGFNGVDASFMRSLSEQSYWSFKQAECAYKGLKKYTKQLKSFNIDYSMLVAPSVDTATKAEAVKKENNTATLDDFISKITWSSPKEVETRNGTMMVETTSATADFWSYWKTNKDEMKARGIGCSQYNGTWQVTRWTKPTTTAKPDVSEINVELKYSDLLLQYQREHVVSLIKSMVRNGSAIDASDTGTGKTYTALAVAKEMGLFPIVMTPKPVKHSFNKVMEKHFGMNGFVSNYEQFKFGKTDFFKVNGDDQKFSGEWIVPANALIIFDEAHKCKKYSTQNAAMLVQAKKQNIKILVMSATIASNPLDMYSVGFVLDLFKDTKGFFRWAKNHGCDKGTWGGFVFDGNREHLTSIHNQIFPNRGSRIRISDLGDMFPETQIISEAYDMNGDSKKIQAIYDEMANEISVLNAKAKNDSSNHLVTLMRARQKIELLKVPTMIEMAQNAIEEGMSVAILVNFNETVTALAEKLETDCLVWGSQKDETRQMNIDKFQNDESRIIIANIRAGGVGISLHDLNGKYARISLISPTWSAQDLVQALGRIHRAGGKSKSIQKIVFAAGTVEEKVARKVGEKVKNISVLNDGSLSDGGLTDTDMID